MIATLLPLIFAHAVFDGFASKLRYEIVDLGENTFIVP